MEHFEDIVNQANVRIERIVSFGQQSPQSGWYEQAQQEWVVVLKGRGIVSYDDGREFDLSNGDSLLIPAQQKHKVSFTDPEQATIWLAVFFD
ncbi:cupin domain-containing protein [Shewanella sp. Scap07]|nr:cupin domain-containing protein [Shewanella sp. Scap07]